MPQEVHVGRRVHQAQHAVHGKRVDRLDEIEALREHDLEDVTFEDVLLGRLDRGRPLRVVEIRTHGRQLGELVGGRERRDVRQGPTEIRDGLGEAFDGRVVIAVQGRVVGAPQRLLPAVAVALMVMLGSKVVGETNRPPSKVQNF